MIPKIIHYCWFGYNPKPKYVKKSIKSWKKKCIGYEFIEWNETNYDISSAPLFVKQAYDSKKWAFVTDYVRLWAVYHHGGLYFDTDMKLLKSPDALLKDHAFFAMEESGRIATGLGFGAEKGFPLITELMHTYETISFIRPDGSLDMVPCGARDTEIFRHHGLKNVDKIQSINHCVIYPPEYFCVSLWRPKTKNTYTISYYSGSWRNPEEIKREKRELRRQKRLFYSDKILHLPNSVTKRILGEKRYNRIKRLTKRR